MLVVNLGMLGLYVLYCIFSFRTVFSRFFGLQCALQHIQTIRRRFGDRSVLGSALSRSQLDWAWTLFSTKISSITSC